MLSLKERLVRLFRYEREVPVNLHGGSSVMSSGSGFASTEYFNLQQLTDEQVLRGIPERGLPSIKSMRSPGIDWLRKIIVKANNIDGLPRDTKRLIRRAPVYTRKEIQDPVEWGYYLRTGKRMSTAMKARLARLRAYLKKQEKDEAEE